MNLLFLNTRGCIMKKLAIVALALVLAMTFVGCGAANLLTGTSWRQEWSGGYTDLSFGADGVCSYIPCQENGTPINTNLVGTWSADGAEVTIAETSVNINGVWTVEIVGDELTLTYVDKISSTDTHKTGDVEKMTRVTDAK
jgi:hypothetical protein